MNRKHIVALALIAHAALVASDNHPQRFHQRCLNFANQQIQNLPKGAADLLVGGGTLALMMRDVQVRTIVRNPKRFRNAVAFAFAAVEGGRFAGKWFQTGCMRDGLKNTRSAQMLLSLFGFKKSPKNEFDSIQTKVIPQEGTQTAPVVPQNDLPVTDTQDPYHKRLEEEIRQHLQRRTSAPKSSAAAGSVMQGAAHQVEKPNGDAKPSESLPNDTGAFRGITLEEILEERQRREQAKLGVQQAVAEMFEQVADAAAALAEQQRRELLLGAYQAATDADTLAQAAAAVSAETVRVQGSSPAPAIAESAMQGAAYQVEEPSGEGASEHSEDASDHVILTGALSIEEILEERQRREQAELDVQQSAVQWGEEIDTAYQGLKPGSASTAEHPTNGRQYLVQDQDATGEQQGSPAAVATEVTQSPRSESGSPESSLAMSIVIHPDSDVASSTESVASATPPSEPASEQPADLTGNPVAETGSPMPAVVQDINGDIHSSPETAHSFPSVPSEQSPDTSDTSNQQTPSLHRD